jgi:hypothetical protein
MPASHPANTCRVPILALLTGMTLLLAGCAGRGAAWNGRRGYDGNGDYGYDLAASGSEARTYRAGAAGFYPPPGPPADPWGPYVRDAASRHRVPEQWIRAVMRQESGGRQYAADGSLITSTAGAMGLMQVMPRTYDMLSARYGLGADPFDPRDNILAGTAYIREMYDRYGAPGFLAAYNAGPDRLEGYLSGAAALPDETINYLARIAPDLGTQVAMTGPLAVFAGTSPVLARNAVPAKSGVTLAAYEPVGPESDASPDPADRAFDGGGLVTASAPTGALASQPAAPPISRLGSPGAMPFVAASGNLPEGWGIQVGAYADPAISRAAIARARAHAGTLLADARPAITTVQRDVPLYRARFTGLSGSSANLACAALLRDGIACLTVPPRP